MRKIKKNGSIIDHIISKTETSIIKINYYFIQYFFVYLAKKIHNFAKQIEF